MDTRQQFVLDRSAVLIVFTILGTLGVLQLLNDRLIMRRQETVGATSRIFHILVTIGAIAFNISFILQLVVGLPDQGVLPAEAQLVRDLVYDVGIQCLYTGSFAFMHYNIEHHRIFTMTSTSGAGDLVTRLSCSARFTIVMCCCAWALAFGLDIAKYVTNRMWITAIYLIAMTIIGGLLIGLASWTCYHLLSSLTGHGLSTDAVSQARRMRRAKLLKRFVFAYFGTYVVAAGAQLIYVKQYFDDTSRPWVKQRPDDPDDFTYTTDPLLILVAIVYSLFLWHSWRPPRICMCCTIFQERTRANRSVHTGDNGTGEIGSSSSPNRTPGRRVGQPGPNGANANVVYHTGSGDDHNSLLAGSSYANGSAATGTGTPHGSAQPSNGGGFNNMMQQQPIQRTPNANPNAPGGRRYMMLMMAQSPPGAAAANMPAFHNHTASNGGVNGNGVAAITGGSPENPTNILMMKTEMAIIARPPSNANNNGTDSARLTIAATTPQPTLSPLQSPGQLISPGSGNMGHHTSLATTGSNGSPSPAPHPLAVTINTDRTGSGPTTNSHDNDYLLGQKRSSGTSSMITPLSQPQGFPGVVNE